MISVKNVSDLLNISPVRIKQILKENPDLNFERVSSSGKIKIPSKTVRKILNSRGKGIERKRLVVKSEKGGVGGSTITANLAVRASETRGAKVLCLDCDGESNLTSFFVREDFDYSKAKTLLEVFKYDTPLRDCIYETRYENVHIVPAKGLIRRVDRLIQNENPKTLMKSLLDQLDELEERYDLIFMDLPPTFSTLSASCYLASTLTILPVEPSIWSIEGATLTKEDIEEFSEKFECKKPEIKVLMNKYNPSRTASKEAMETLNEEFGKDVLPVKIKESAQIANATNEAKSVFEAPCKNEIRASFDELLEYIAPIEDEERILQ